MSALLESLRLHQPLPAWAQDVAPSAPQVEPTPINAAPPLIQQVLVNLNGSNIFCAFERDDDGAPFATLVQIGSRWWEVEQVHTKEWIAALNRALEDKLLAEREEQP